MVPDSVRIPKNWFYAPSVYNSRVSSVVPSGTALHRPKGVFYQPGTEQVPKYGPSEALDFELEMGYFVSKPVPFGEVMDISDAKEHIFGFVLLNDWSARDLQMFEMKPLGPFHGKGSVSASKIPSVLLTSCAGFGTSISNWIITLDALEPFSCNPKTVQKPAPFDHLRWKNDGDGALDIKLRVTLIRPCWPALSFTVSCNRVLVFADNLSSNIGNERRYQLSTSNLKYLYWTPYQQLTHHASAGCGMQTGDLIGTGTVSGDVRLTPHL